MSLPNPEVGLNPDLVIRAFAQAGSHLPREAMTWSLDHWAEVVPLFLERLEAFADKTDRSKETGEILFFAVHLMGEARETRAFDPLIRICLDGSAMDAVIGDGITTTLTGILIGTFDGRVERLQAVIEAEGADEFVRDAALEVYAYLAAAGQVGLDEAQTYLSGLYGTMLPQAENYVWVGWQEAVARLGLSDLKDQVAEAFGRGFIGRAMMDYGHFEGGLDSSRHGGTPLEAFVRKGVGPIADVVEELGRWYGFSDAYRESLKRSAERAKTGDLDRWEPSLALPHVSPARKVGRNEPCPCGSGRKFKKCCLAA